MRVNSEKIYDPVEMLMYFPYAKVASSLVFDWTIWFLIINCRLKTWKLDNWKSIFLSHVT